MGAVNTCAQEELSLKFDRNSIIENIGRTMVSSAFQGSPRKVIASLAPHSSN